MASWYQDGKRYREFGQSLIEAGVLEDVDDFQSFFDDPSSYNEVYDAWVDADMPMNAEEDGWEDFTNAISDSDDEDDESEDEEE